MDGGLFGSQRMVNNDRQTDDGNCFLWVAVSELNGTGDERVHFCREREDGRVVVDGDGWMLVEERSGVESWGIKVRFGVGALRD
jgi:hypothetical protein